ncbi:MAG: hypothetical protein AAB646_01715 [Patescibacteria group bacterium]
MRKFYLAIWLLRIGLAFSFFYAAIDGFVNPENWIGWLPEFIRTEGVLVLFEIIELIAGFWLLSGYLQFWSGIISGLMMAGIVVFNLGAMLVVFRDVGLALSAFALAALSKHDERERNKETS